MKKRICSIITMVLCVLTFVCLFVPWVKLDLSPITGSISSFFADIKLWEDGIKYSVIDICQKLADYKEDIGNFFWLFIGCIIIQYVFPVAVFALSWLKGKAKYIANLVLSCVSILVVLGIHKLLIPQTIEKILNKIMDDSISGNVLSLFHVKKFIEAFAEEAGKAYSKSLSVGFYILLVIMVLVIIVSIVGIVLESMDREEEQGSGRSAGSGQQTAGAMLVGITGIFKGANIPVSANEELIIGRDPSQCHLIIESEQISRKHCAIRFDNITGQYKVTDFSSNGTFINNERRIMRNQPQFVPRGAVLSIGDGANSFRLS